MRVLPLLTVIALASSCGAATSDKTGVATTTNSDIAFLSRALAAEYQHKRSLRPYDGDVSVNLDSDGEGDERAGTSQNMEELVEKFAHLGFTARGFDTSALTGARQFAADTKAVAKLYPGGRALSNVALQQLALIEHMRETDTVFKRLSKETGDGMRREIEHFEGMKYAPVLESHTGRELQRYYNGRRLLSCIVASRADGQGEGQVLLISSSNPAKRDWVLPKGGWDHGETVEKAAWRELIEEGGVEGTVRFGLDPITMGDKVYYPFRMAATTVYDQWAESMRYRIWVSYDDAKKLLSERPEMLAVLKAVREAE